MLDIYTDYLICQNKYATATGLSELMSGEVTHDKITRFLSSNEQGSKELWEYIKPSLRRHEEASGGVLILDDSIEEKPYTDENEIVCWHYSHTHKRHVKGVNIISCLVNYGEVSLPVGYEIVRKEMEFCDAQTQQLKRQASVSKNEHFRKLLRLCKANSVLFDYVLADNWFGAKENFEFIHKELGKFFIIGIKSNRIVALTKEDKLSGRFQRVSSLEMEDGQSKKVWLKGLSFELVLLKKVFTNEDGSTGVLYLVSNDLDRDADCLYQIYQKRWKIEMFHKSIKQNASLEKSPTKRVRTQANHIFASMVAFCKLELLHIATATNHFALKYKLLVKANLASMHELALLKQSILPA